MNESRSDVLHIFYYRERKFSVPCFKPRRAAAERYVKLQTQEAELCDALSSPEVTRAGLEAGSESEPVLFRLRTGAGGC